MQEGTLETEDISEESILQVYQTCNNTEFEVITLAFIAITLCKDLESLEWGRNVLNLHSDPR